MTPSATQSEHGGGALSACGGISPIRSELVEAGEQSRRACHRLVVCAGSLSGTTMGAVGLLGAMDSLDAEGADAYPRKRRRGDLSPTSQM
jgi:hypothetical protein